MIHVSPLSYTSLFHQLHQSILLSKRYSNQLTIGSFLPVTIESLAREEGVLLSDKTTSCIKSTIPVNAIRSLTSILSRDHNDTDGNGQCIVSFFGAEVNSASYALYTFSLAVFIQALVLVSFSGVADHGWFLLSSPLYHWSWH